MEEEKDYFEELDEIESKFSWKDLIEKDKKGKMVKSPQNILLFLENHPKYAGKLKYNGFLQMKEYDGKEFTDFQQSVINNDVFKYLGFSNKGWVDDCLNQVFLEHTYNPVIDYLKSLTWDGKKRIDTMFIKMFQADDTELNRTMTRKWMIAAVKRILIPGCKFDNMIVLQGGQGIGKSTFCERLARGFYNSISLNEIDNKDVVDKLNKTWIGIIDELNNFNRKDMNVIKGFLSESQKGARLAYARNTLTYERHCVFIGTTNEDTFLRDITSTVERRFWIIRCNKTKMDSAISDTMTPDYVDQLWAEAYKYYMDDPEQYLDIEQDMFEEFAEAQYQFKTSNDDDIVSYLKDVLEKEYKIGPEGEVTDISQIDDEYAAGLKYPVNKIKGYVIRELLYRKFRESRSLQYLGNALEGWKYTDVTFKSTGGHDRALVRTAKKEITVKHPQSPFDEFEVSLKIARQ